MSVLIVPPSCKGEVSKGGWGIMFFTFTSPEIIFFTIASQEYIGVLIIFIFSSNNSFFTSLISSSLHSPLIIIIFLLLKLSGFFLLSTFIVRGWIHSGKTTVFGLHLVNCSDSKSVLIVHSRVVERFFPVSFVKLKFILHSSLFESQ